MYIGDLHSLPLPLVYLYAYVWMAGVYHRWHALGTELTMEHRGIHLGLPCSVCLHPSNAGASIHRSSTYLAHMAFTAWLAVRNVCSSGSPVIGLVLWRDSQSSMALRSYVCPSAVTTGSTMTAQARTQARDASCAGQLWLGGRGLRSQTNQYLTVRNVLTDNSSKTIKYS